MNDYIIFDGYKYATKAGWQPFPNRPMTTRQLANGNLDVTYGRKILNFWEGEIMANFTETRSGYGTSSDIETSLAKLESFEFTDHYENQYTVHVQTCKRRALHQAWQSPSIKFYYAVRLVANA